MQDNWNALVAVGHQSDGWELGPQGPATGESIYLGSFQRSIAADVVAVVEFILESGPRRSGGRVSQSGTLVVSSRFERDATLRSGREATLRDAASAAVVGEECDWDDALADGLD